MIYDDLGNLFIPFEQKCQSCNDIYEKKKCKNNKNFFIKNDWIPRTIYAKNFLFKNLIGKKKNSRYVCILGHLHHGKSTLVNAISSSVHLVNDKSLFQDFSDFFYLEKQRGISIQSSITTLLLCDNRGKSCIISLIDCPGHPEFFDQSVTGIKVSDGCLLMIDIADGVLIGTELSLRNSIIEGLSIVVILNAIDRLILEYGYSTKTLHKKIVQILDELNSILEECILKSSVKNVQNIKFFNPNYNNVCFSSFIQGWSFTLEQYSEIYISCQPSIGLSVKDLSSKFWNNFYYEEKKHPSKKAKIKTKQTMFMKFVLEPLYKLTFLSITEPTLHIQKFFETELGLYGINQSEFITSRKNLTTICFGFFFGGCRQSKLTTNHTGLISAVLRHIPYFTKTSNFKKNFFKKTIGISSIGYICKFCPSRDNTRFLALARIIKGFLKNKTFISLVTEGHKFYLNQNFYLTCEIEEIFLPIGRYNINISNCSCGSIVFIKGLDKVVRRSAVFFKTKLMFNYIENFYFCFIKILLSVNLFSPLIVTLKPLYSFQLKKLYASLRKCCKIYSGLSCETNETGMIVLCGPGELYLDCVLHDVRFVFENIDIKTSYPLCNLKESIESDIFNDTESCIAKKMKINLYKNSHTLNETYILTKNQVFPMKKTKFSTNYWKYLKNSIKSGLIIKKFEDSTVYDKINANSFWFFGPQGISFSSCCLLAKFDTKKITCKFKNKIFESFNLTINQGPLSFEPLYKIRVDLKNTCKNFQLLASQEKFTGDLRKILYGIFLRKNSYIFEPYYFSELIFHFRFLPIVIRLIRIKSGYILSSSCLSEENIFIIRCSIPITKYIGLESELDFLTSKNASIFTLPDKWEKISNKSTKNKFSINSSIISV